MVLVAVTTKPDGPPRPRPESPLAERLSFFVQHLTRPEVEQMPAHEVERLLLRELPAAERTLRLRAFDQLSLRVRGPRQAVPHYPHIYTFLRTTARERLVELAAALAAAPDLRVRNLLLLSLHNLRRAPMPREIIDGADALLARYALPAAQVRAEAGRPRAAPRLTPPSCESVALRTVASYVALQPVRKHKVSPQHLRASAVAGTNIRVSSFEVAGHPSYSGLVSSTFQLGGYCKLRVLLTEQNELFAVRQAPTQAQGQVRARRVFADGSVGYNHRLGLLEPMRYLHERQAQRLAHSSLHPKLTLFDHKQRLWDVVPLFNGDMFGLCESFGPGEMPGGILLRTAQAVLRVSAALDDYGWQHNDVKPENVLWRRSGEVELGDLGLAGPTEAPGHPGTCGYLDPEAVLHPARRRGRGDLYALAMTLVHLVDPYRFDEFPLAFHADGLAPSAEHYLPRLRVAALRAEQTWDAWRSWRNEKRTQAGSLEDPPLPMRTPSPEVAAVEEAWEQLRRAAGEKLADLALLRWASPRPNERGRPREQLEALNAAYPESDAQLEYAAAIFAETGESNLGARRIDATVDALTNFRDVYARAAPQRARSTSPAGPPTPAEPAV